MVYLGDILIITFEQLLRIKNWWDEREKKKGIKERILNTLDLQIANYKEGFNELIRIGEEEVIPLLDSIKVGPTETQLNRFFRISAKTVGSFSRIVDSFVNLAKGFKLISINPGFMEDLKESSRFLLDFVVRMADMCRDNVVVVDDNFYMFLKLYEKELTEDIEKKDVTKAVEYLKPYISKTKNIIAPSIARRKPRRKTSRKIEKSFKTFRRTTKQLKIQHTTIKIEKYIPSKFKPITLLLEEISEIQSSL